MYIYTIHISVYSSIYIYIYIYISTMILGYSTCLILGGWHCLPRQILLPRCVHCFYAVLVDVGYVRHGHTFRAGWLPPKSDPPGVNLPGRSLSHFMSILVIPGIEKESLRNKTRTYENNWKHMHLFVGWVDLLDWCQKDLSSQPWLKTIRKGLSKISYPIPSTSSASSLSFNQIEIS